VGERKLHSSVQADPILSQTLARGEKPDKAKLQNGTRGVKTRDCWHELTVSIIQQKIMQGVGYNSLFVYLRLDNNELHSFLS
jgi:hypothetical protein